MDKELYIGVDVSKQTLDLAYYDGESIDWKKAHIKGEQQQCRFQENWFMGGKGKQGG